MVWCVDENFISLSISKSSFPLDENDNNSSPPPPLTNFISNIHEHIPLPFASARGHKKDHQREKNGINNNNKANNEMTWNIR